jgi:hypothetical protein
MHLPYGKVYAMAAKKKPAVSSAVSVPGALRVPAHHPDITLGIPWPVPDSPAMPDPNVPGVPALTEQGETLTGPDGSAGLGFSRYA